jgi:hypothetical protein
MALEATVHILVHAGSVFINIMHVNGGFWLVSVRLMKLEMR